MEDKSKRIETVTPQSGEDCESPSECGGVLSVKSDGNDIELNGETDDEDMEWRQNTSSYAHNAWYRRTFSRARVTRHQRTCVGSSVSGITPRLSKVIFISSMFHGMLLDPHLTPRFSSPLSTPFPAPTLLSTPSLLNSSTGPNLCALAEQIPLAGYEPKSLVEVNSEHQLPLERGQLRHRLQRSRSTLLGARSKC